MNGVVCIGHSFGNNRRFSSKTNQLADGEEAEKFGEFDAIVAQRSAEHDAFYRRKSIRLLFVLLFVCLFDDVVILRRHSSGDAERRRSACRTHRIRWVCVYNPPATCCRC
jgi:hypothetical protein